MFNGIKLALQRRIIAAVAALAAGSLGLQGFEGLGGTEATEMLGKLFKAALGFASAAALVWSYLRKIERAELGRRLWPALLTAASALAAGLGAEIPKEALADVQVTGGLVVASVMGVWSFLLERQRLVPSGRLASPNP